MGKAEEGRVDVSKAEQPSSDATVHGNDVPAVAVAAAAATAAAAAAAAAETEAAEGRA